MNKCVYKFSECLADSYFCKNNRMDFNAWAKSMGLNDKTSQASAREDLSDHDALRERADINYSE